MCVCVCVCVCERERGCGRGGGGGGATVIPNLGIVGEIRLIKTFYSKFGCCVFICVTFWANQLFPILSQRILIRPCLFKYIYRHLFTILISKNYPLYLQLIAISEISPHTPHPPHPSIVYCPPLLSPPKPAT